MPKKNKKFKLKLPKFRIWYLLFLIPILVFLGAFYYYILRDLPSPTSLKGDKLAASTHIYDRNGALLYTIYADRNQTFVPLKDIPGNVQNATIAIEDKDFYKHGAVDLRGIARAAYATLFKERLEGGSTLTQQLVKNTLLTPERTVQRKIKEVLLAFAIEMLYSKEQILEMYLNQVPYGGTAYGIESAAKTYFGKSARDLTLAESSMLAGLPVAPTTYSPFGAYPELAKNRQREVLNAMLSEGYINQDEYSRAIEEKLVYKDISQDIKAPHFVLYVKDLLVQKYGQEKVEQGGLKVITSLDLPIQDFAQLAVASEVAKLENYRVSNGAALVTNPGTGEILAMVGSRDYFTSEETDGAVNVTLAKRQPGSSIKPINYATGLVNGYSAATLFVDKAVCFPNPPQKPYCPRNYDGKFSGPVLMREALARSLNIPAVQMLKMNGIESMIATASAMGISTFKDPDQYGLSLTLGGGEVMMIDMATAFGVFANQGYRIDLHPILKVTDRNGDVLEEYTPPKSPMFGKKVLPSGVAFIISHILQDNAARAPAFGINSDLRIDNLPVSVKTGTTNDLRDNWTIGYTPEILVATWVGNNDNTPMAGIASGVTGASPIWNEIMSHLLEGKTVTFPKQPSSIIEKFVCNYSTTVPADGSVQPCSGRREYFIRGTENKTSQASRRPVFIDTTTGDLAKPGQTENVEQREETIVTDALGNQYCVTCPHPTPSPTP